MTRSSRSVISIAGSPMIGYSVTPRWKDGIPPLVLISPTRSSCATLRQASSCSFAGRSAISVIMPTLTEPVLRIPRNLPTVAFDESGAALAGLSPTVTCAPLTESTRPITLRFADMAAGAGAAGATAAAGAGAGVGAGADLGAADPGAGAKPG